MLSDPPVISVDKLYLSQRGELSLELVCSAQSNPPARLGWSRLDTRTGQWREISQETGGAMVWTVNRQVSLVWSFSVVTLYSHCLWSLSIVTFSGHSL